MSAMLRRTAPARGMTRRLGLAMAAGLVALPQISSAADAKWVAVASLEKGTPQCGSGQSNWQIEITGTTLKYLNVAANRSSTVDLKGLQPDGSGKVTGKDEQNREFNITFEPGSGARPMRSTNSSSDCVWVFTPKK